MRSQARGSGIGWIFAVLLYGAGGLCFWWGVSHFVVNFAIQWAEFGLNPLTPKQSFVIGAIIFAAVAFFARVVKYTSVNNYRRLT